MSSALQTTLKVQAAPDVQQEYLSKVQYLLSDGTLKPASFSSCPKDLVCFVSKWLVIVCCPCSVQLVSI